MARRKNLRAARRAKGWTQKELAECVGLKRAAITSIENAVSNGSQPVWRKLATILGKPVEHLWQLAD